MKIYLAFIALVAFVLLEACVATKVNDGSPHAVSPRKFQFHRQSLLKPTPDQKQMTTPATNEEAEEEENSLPKSETPDFNQFNNVKDDLKNKQHYPSYELLAQNEDGVDTAKKKIFVKVSEFNKKPAALKNSTINAVLRQEAPAKFDYLYRYLFKGTLIDIKDFDYDKYLKEKGAGTGSYPGDAVVIIGNKYLYIFSDSLPDDNWFSYQYLEK